MTTLADVRRIYTAWSNEQAEAIDVLDALGKYLNPPRKARAYRRTAVRCSNGETYENAAAAADALKVSRALVSSHLKNPDRYKTVAGQRLWRV